jgi:hypothetical protein
MKSEKRDLSRTSEVLFLYSFNIVLFFLSFAGKWVLHKENHY